MSDFHGGFFVRSLDASVAERIRLALATALRARRVEAEANTLTVAVARGCPVMHVAVRGPIADGKDYAFFHHRHSDLGAEVARAAGVEVWAYHYENQSGSESVRAFGPDGGERSNVYCSWDDLHDQLDLPEDVDDDERHEQLLEAAPLGVLARELGVDRGVLDYDLGYAPDAVQIPLTGSDSQIGAITGYLASRCAADVGVKPDSRIGMAVQGLYFPGGMIEEIEAHARRLDVPLGAIAWAIWEAAKPELFAKVPIVDADRPRGDSTQPARFMVPPASEPPPDVVVPRLVPVFAKSLPAMSPASDPASDTVLRKIAVPPRVLEEIQAFAAGADRSLSWSMQSAYKLVRGRMHHATRPSPADE